MRVVALLLPTVVVGTVGMTYAPTASANTSDTAVVVTVNTQSEIHVALCLNALDLLPMNVAVRYEARTDDATVASGILRDEDPNAAVLMAPGCPSEFTSFAITGLSSQTMYSITVDTTMTPKIVDEDGIRDDPSRPARHDSVSITAHTLPTSAARPTQAPQTSSPAGTSGSSGAGAEEAADQGTVTEQQRPDSSAEVDDLGAIVEILKPTEFTASAMALLTPGQVAAIEPSAFRLFPPRTFRGLRPDQAAELTAEQASSIRPRRASQLRPAAVAALGVEALRSLRPASVRFLRPAAVQALTPRQLSALTPRQVAALRPIQLSRLTRAQLALLASTPRGR